MQEMWAWSLGQETPGKGNGNPLQNSCLGNLMDRGAWRATVHAVRKELDMTWQLNNNSKVLRIELLLQVSDPCLISLNNRTTEKLTGPGSNRCSKLEFRRQKHPSLLTAVSSSVQFSRSVVSDSLRPHELHARPPCPSPTPTVYSNSCPLIQWCHPAISSSVIPFSSCPQSLPASGSFPMSQLFAPGGQSIGVSASASVLPMNTQDWSPSGWTGWISLESKGLSRVFSNTTVQKHQFFGPQFSS